MAFNPNIGMTITTQDCKNALVARYPDTTAKSWKRTRKYLNAFGQWERVFECNQPGHVRTVVLQERNGQLFEAVTTPLQPLPHGLVVIECTVDNMPRVLFGASGPETLSLPFVPGSPEQMQFLLVLERTIDWDAQQYERSTYDAAKGIDFKDFTARCTVQGIDLLGSYLEYMVGQLQHLEGLDEEEFVGAGALDYDDSVADMHDVLNRIRQGYMDNGWEAPLDAALVLRVRAAAQSLRTTGLQTYDPSDDDAVEAFAAIDRVARLAP